MDCAYWVCVFFVVAGIHPCRTWTSISFKPVWWTVCMHWLILVYTVSESCREPEPMVTPREKYPKLGSWGGKDWTKREREEGFLPESDYFSWHAYIILHSVFAHIILYTDDIYKNKFIFHELIPFSLKVTFSNINNHFVDGRNVSDLHTNRLTNLQIFLLLHF